MTISVSHEEVTNWKDVFVYESKFSFGIERLESIILPMSKCRPRSSFIAVIGRMKSTRKRQSKRKEYKYKYALFICAEETGFEPARACLRAQGVSNPPQWANYATPPNSQRAQNNLGARFSCDSSEWNIKPADDRLMKLHFNTNEFQKRAQHEFEPL